jgi:hypothetical protein
MQVKKTSDYTIFKKLPGNREIEPGNLKKITASLKMNNMLELNPILVDSEMRVMNGQHRLEAAKNLGIEVYYKVDENIKSSDLLLLQTQKSWTLEDFVRYHAAQGINAYVDIVKLSEKYSISITEAIQYLGIGRGGKGYIALKEGKTTENIKEKENDLKDKIFKIEQIRRLIEEKTIGEKKYLISRYFTRSLLALIDNSSFDFDVFIQKLNLGLGKVHHCTTVDQYYDMFKAIYNVRNQDPID